MKLTDKVVFISGANRGIGKALLEACLKKGVKKVYAGARDPSKIAKEDRVIPVKLDILNPKELADACKVAGDTEILINNAGILNPGTSFGGDLEGFRADMEVNYFGTLGVMRAFLPILEKKEMGSIVNIASIVKYLNLPSIAGYAASKSALFSISQAARIELSHKNIVVHTVNPGAIDTDMNKGSQMEMTSPEEVAFNILEEFEKGVLDIFPDKMSEGMLGLYKQDPAELEALSRKIYFQE